MSRLIHLSQCSAPWLQDRQSPLNPEPLYIIGCHPYPVFRS